MSENSVKHKESLIRKEDMVNVDYEHLFSDEEKLEISKNMTEVLDEIYNLESEKSHTAKRYKTLIDSEHERLKELQSKFKLGKEMRTITATKVKDYVEGKIKYIDSNGEIVKTEAMLPDEYQTGIEEMIQD